MEHWKIIRSVALLALAAIALALPSCAFAEAAAHRASETQASAFIALAELPPEARTTVLRIREGGPFPFERDGVVFGNREGLLPSRSRGYYREYTVVTPRVHGRGAKRIIAGRAGELYYTDDHYRSFRRVRE